jgi:hypothetical protein
LPRPPGARAKSPGGRAPTENAAQWLGERRVEKRRASAREVSRWMGAARDGAGRCAGAGKGSERVGKGRRTCVKSRGRRQKGCRGACARFGGSRGPRDRRDRRGWTLPRVRRPGASQKRRARSERCARRRAVVGRHPKGGQPTRRRGKGRRVVMCHVATPPTLARTLAHSCGRPTHGSWLKQGRPANRCGRWRETTVRWTSTR